MQEVKRRSTRLCEGTWVYDFSFLDQEIDIIYSQGGKLFIRSFNIEKKSAKGDKGFTVHIFY